MTTEPPEFSDHEEEGAAPEPPPAPEPAAPESAAPAAADDNIFSSGEGMVALAGGIIVAVWVIFEVFLDDYGVTTTAVVAAILAVLLPRLNPDSVAKVMPVATAMKLLGYLLAIVGVIEIVGDVEVGVFSDADFSTIIAALAAYAAYAIAFLGARSIDN